jgi:agmatine deiminase
MKAEERSTTQEHRQESMISDSETNLVFISDLLESRYPLLVDRLRGILTEHGIPLRIIRGTKDIWCRDFMPVQVGLGTFVRFRYGPDYLIGSENLITKFDEIDPISEIVTCQHSEVVLDGGNVVRWGKRAIITDKAFRENSGLKKFQLFGMLWVQLQVDEVIVIPNEPDDVIGHADGMVRFLDAETVFINDYSKVDPSFRRGLLRLLRRARLKWIDLPYCPVAEVIDGIPSAVGCYANFLMVRGLIVLPTFGIPEDDIARHVLVERAPHFAIESIDCTDLAKEGGVLNCVTWTIVAEEHSYQQKPELERRLLDVQDGALEP